MVKVLLDKIGNVLDKEFLFGSFLPALLFVGALAVSAAGIVGFEASLAWAGQLGPLDKVLYPFAGALIIVVFAYALSALRPLMVRAWAGQATPWFLVPLFELATTFARRDFLRRRAESLQENPWAILPELFAGEADQSWETSTTAATSAQVTQLRTQIVLSPSDPAASKKALQVFLNALTSYSGQSLGGLYAELYRQVAEWSAAEDSRLHTLRLHLDRSFGPFYCVRPTRIGNIIESYTDYSYTRYRIEPEAFWPHLQQHIGDALKAQLADTRTMLYFALTLASLAIGYGSICLVVGPRLWLTPLWFLYALISFIIAWVSYRVAVVAAEAFGDVFRACFDVHRLDLLRALRRRIPPSLAIERERWKQLSQLIMYGDTTVTDFEITPEATK